MTATLTQRETALTRANQVRTGIYALRRELAAGRVELVDAIHDKRGERMTIAALLCAQRQWGPSRSRELLARLQIRETRRCEELTLRQKGLIVAEVWR